MAYVHPSRAGHVPEHDQHREHTPERRRERSPDGRRRRPSPSYGEYKRPVTPPVERAPWQTEGSMYPPRPSRDGSRQDGPPPRNNGYRGGWSGGGGGGGLDWLASRRQQREQSTKSIWPPSPKAPTRDESPDRSKHSKRHKRSYSVSSSSSVSDAEDRHKRKKHSSSRRDKDRHRSSKHRHSSSKHKSSRHHKSSTSSRRKYHSDTESDADSDDSRGQHRSRSEEKGKGRSQTEETVDEELDWVEKPAESALERTIHDLPSTTGTINDSTPLLTTTTTTTTVTSSQALPDDDDSDVEIGPLPVTVASSSRPDERSYGGALLRGEGSAMAAFIQNNERIPRRGEIGLESLEIEKYEQAGYVMSGSRHRRMNAVRMRKENQVISAEEKRSILKMQKEEKEKREGLIVSGFKEMLEDKLKGSSATTGRK